ncbi:helix-turn-helix domain-containing protein [Caldicellulosiruptoraceae bacterium PP1]
MQQFDNKLIGMRIREQREKLGLSRQELSEIVGLSDYYIGQLERGERQMSLPVLINIANILHISLDKLIYGNDLERSYIKDTQENYKATLDYDIAEINELIKNCSQNELRLIKKIIKLILPYINNK